jgi:hypothetical protein
MRTRPFARQWYKRGIDWWSALVHFQPRLANGPMSDKNHGDEDATVTQEGTSLGLTLELVCKVHVGASHPASVIVCW